MVLGWLAQAQDLPEPQQLVWPLVATGILAVLGIVTWLARAARRGWRAARCWVREQAAAVQQAQQAAQRAAAQTATSNGHTAGELVEDTAARVARLERTADANRVRLDALDTRLDRHIITGHRPE